MCLARVLLCIEHDNLRAHLAALLGYTENSREIIPCATLDEAWQLFQRFHPCILILQAQPHSLEILRQIRLWEVNRNYVCRVHLIAPADLSHTERANFYDAGVDYFEYEPLDKIAFRNRIWSSYLLPLRTTRPIRRLLLLIGSSELRAELELLLKPWVYIWEVFDNPETALQALQTQRFSLVIGEGAYPMWDSVNLLRQINADRTISRIPVILIYPANITREEKIRVLEAGVSDILVTSFDSATLLSRLQQLHHRL
jgi:two-component system, chemotaxis family, chemotaxis protein CheY